MNEDVLNTSIRKFLKEVGVTSQREIEKAVREALAAGRLKGNESLPVKMVLTIDTLSLSHEVHGSIVLE
jgi:ribosomal protein L1